ncbi:hypothetical protein T484DRAFT_1901999 [Baffinella frigidus]|nr:hypothetical protein T484DRAFT_1901999 [Cryptophyta sp. CCMP2293]
MCACLPPLPAVLRVAPPLRPCCASLSGRAASCLSPGDAARMWKDTPLSPLLPPLSGLTALACLLTTVWKEMPDSLLELKLLGNRGPGAFPSPLYRNVDETSDSEEEQNMAPAVTAHSASLFVAAVKSRFSTLITRYHAARRSSASDAEQAHHLWGEAQHLRKEAEGLRQKLAESERVGEAMRAFLLESHSLVG